MRATEARAILGTDLLSLDEIATVVGVGPIEHAGAGNIPLTTDDLRAAKENDELLIFRLGSDGTQPLTINRFIERFPAAFDPKVLAKVGYLLRDEWGITLEPLAKTETCTPGWALVRKTIVPATRNRSYFEQEEVLRAAGTSPALRRRTAVEAVHDLVFYHACRDRRLLFDAFDWTSSRTVDGGFLNVGGFGESGMTITGFSAAVRHGTLGVCPTRSLS